MSAREAEAPRPGAHPSYLYARLLAGSWSGLPPQIQRMHALERELTATGEATVERGTGWLSRLIGGMAGFPPAGETVPVRVDFTRSGGVETWKRTFGAHVFASTQERGRERLLIERFGPMAFGMALQAAGDRLLLKLRRGWLFGAPLPDALMPMITAYETVADGRFTFFVEISHPLAGLIVRYQGWLEPVIPAQAPAAA